MIPKIIHYCWFGRAPLPNDALKCIESWKKYFPDYEIKEWNEENFDVDIVPYTSEAYKAKKYAFVSDYARFWILYHYGGIYFDTDVEVIKSMNDILEAGPFMGFEVNPCKSRPNGAVAPGLGMAANPQMDLFLEILDYYSNQNFVIGVNSVTVVGHTTNILLRNGLQQIQGIQKVAGFNLYPADFFNPFDDGTGKLYLTNNTRTIHWYSKSWIDNRIKWRIGITRLIHRYVGSRYTGALRKFLEKKLNRKL